MLCITDTQIKEDLLRELRHNLRADAMKIEVNVSGYVVTLAGTVKTANDRLLAQEAASSVEGVHGVVNELVTDSEPQLPTDDEIARALRHAFEWDTQIPDPKIRSTVRNGWVGLEGTVTFSHERENAERMARRMVGVRGVYNEIVVKPEGLQEENVRDRIEDALRCRALLEARNVKVETTEDVVVLSGLVQSWDERCAIIKAAGRAPGVAAVRDNLSIRPSF